MKRLISLFALFVLVALGGCGEENEPTQDPYVPIAGEPIAFRPASGATPFGEIPWPSDLYRNPDGSIGEIPGLERLASTPANLRTGLAALDGFGRSTGALFFLDAAVDAQSLPRTWQAANAADASVFLIDVDPTSTLLGTRYPAYAKHLPSLRCIAVIPVPGIVLPPGVRHAAVVTTRARAVNGRPLVADVELQRIAAAPPSSAADRIDHLYGNALDQLVATRAVTRRNEVAGLAVFTTSRRVFELASLRQRLYEEPPPDLILDPGAAAPFQVAIFSRSSAPSIDDWLGFPEKDENGREWPGGDNPGGIAHDEIGVVASAAFVAPSFLDRRTRHFEVDAATGTIALANAAAKVPVTLVIPKGPPPAGGYPVVIHGHGLSNHRGSMLGVANELARAGFAMIGIDDVQHGTRLAGTKDVLNTFPGSYEGSDGIPDDAGLPISFFGGFQDFIAIRDNFRQTILDQMSLVRLIANIDLAPLAGAAGGFVPKLDAQRIYWSGGSLGGIVGSMTIAVEPRIRAAALQVPGASFIQLITTGSAQLAPLISNLATGAFGLQGNEALDEFHPLALLLGAVTEAGDPIAYAPHLFANRLLPDREPADVLVSYAAYDEVLPNNATVALIRAFGLALAAPNLFAIDGIPTLAAPIRANMASGRSGAAVQYMPANHGLGYARFDSREFLPGFPSDGAERFPKLPNRFVFEQPVRQHLAQLVTFLDSVARGQPGLIEVPVTPRPDYDADGVLDDDERRQGTDPADPFSR